MARELVTKYAPYVDEIFSQESKKSLLTNNDFDFDGAGTVKIYKVSTADMNDYGRNGAADGNWSRYGKVADLDATTETMTLSKDRSFTFVIDKLDENETARQLSGATALARQVRNVVVPEVDMHVYSKAAAGAGTVLEAELTSTNIYEQILLASKTLDDELVTEEGRVLVVTPDVYRLMKLNKGNCDGNGNRCRYAKKRRYLQSGRCGSGKSASGKTSERLQLYADTSMRDTVRQMLEDYQYTLKPAGN